MGLLRIYLALCVLLAHARGEFFWNVHSAREAVQIFFLISGFYMQLIFNNYKGLGEFYTSRLIRIFCPYYAVLIMVIAGSLLAGLVLKDYVVLAPFQHAFEKNGVLGVVITSATNLSLIGQDWVMFLMDDRGSGLKFTSNFWENLSPLYQYLIIPQAWTVGVELAFYFSLPLLVNLKQRYLSMVIIASVGARLYFYYGLGFLHDPWTYRFFPFELALFALGMTSCRFYQKNISSFDRVSKNRVINTEPLYWLKILPLFLFFWTTNYLHPILARYLGYQFEWAKLLSYLGWALVIPVLFHASKSNKVDRYIGELSYPVYLIHMAVITFLARGYDHLNISMDANMNTWVVIALTVLLSIAPVHAVVIPTDRLRHRQNLRHAGLIAREPVGDTTEDKVKPS